jgi:hypothetical protein
MRNFEAAWVVSFSGANFVNDYDRGSRHKQLAAVIRHFGRGLDGAQLYLPAWRASDLDLRGYVLDILNFLHRSCGSPCGWDIREQLVFLSQGKDEWAKEGLNWLDEVLGVPGLNRVL